MKGLHTQNMEAFKRLEVMSSEALCSRAQESASAEALTEFVSAIWSEISPSCPMGPPREGHEKGLALRCILSYTLESDLAGGKLHEGEPQFEPCRRLFLEVRCH